MWKYPKENTLNSHSLFFSPLLSSLGSLSMGLQKETWDWNDVILFRCLPIYRHLKKEKNQKEHLFLKNSQQTWLETLLKSCRKTWLKNLLKRRGGLSPCGRQGHMGMDPNSTWAYEARKCPKGALQKIKATLT